MAVQLAENVWQGPHADRMWEPAKASKITPYEPVSSSPVPSLVPSFGASLESAATETPAFRQALTATGPHASERMESLGPMPEHDFGIADLLDIINPLQHLPGIAQLYREITGDEISGAAQVMGSALYGGPLGLVVGTANAAIREASGKDLGGQILATLRNEPATEDNTTLAAIDLPPALVTAAPPPDFSAPKPDAAAVGAVPPLEGQAALKAFLGDLRGLDTALDAPSKSPTALLQQSSRSFSLEGVPRTTQVQGPSQAAASQIKAGTAPSVPEAGVDALGLPDRMMMALSKYEAMMVRRGNGGS